MKKLILTFLIAFLFNSGFALAHDGHGKISSKAAIQIAVKVTQQLTFKDFGFDVGKLDKSWKELTTDDFKLFSAQTNRYIISGIKKVNNDTIYFLMSLSGEVIKVNSDGKF